MTERTAVDEMDNLTGDGLDEMPTSPAGGPTPPDAPLDERTTDVGYAEQLAVLAKARVRYAEAERAWYVYDGTRWARGSDTLVVPFVHRLARRYYRLAETARTKEERAQAAKEAVRLETDRVIRGIINQARALPTLQIDPTAFDRDPDLLNVLNGTIDLRTGDLLKHDASHMLSKLVPVEYDSTAKSALWDETVRLVTARWGIGGVIEEDAAMARFIQQMFGYALTGHTSEKVFLIICGPTGTGKTTLVIAFKEMLGKDYAAPLRPEALMRTREPEKIPHEIAALRGLRFVVCSEVPGQQRFNEALLKDLTGGDPISASFKYGNAFSFTPHLTLVWYSNHRPELSGGDDAVWARALSVPFVFDFRKYPQMDKTVRDRLKEPEHQRAILAWAVQGCLDWRAYGLEVPERVRADTEAHRAEISSVGRFLSERCEVAKLGQEFAPDEAAGGHALHRAYLAWDRQQPAPEKLAAGPFALELARLGHESKKVITQARHTRDTYLSLRLLPGEEEKPF